MTGIRRMTDKQPELTDRGNLMWNWLRRWLRRCVSRRPQLLSFEVSAEEVALVEFWAQRQGTTTSEWLRELVARAIPTSERRKFESRYKIGECLDFGEALLDADENALLPAHEPEEEPEPENPTVLRIPKDHNCAHLDDKTFPAFFDAASCYGTCDHRIQRGRPCFWPTQTSFQCDHFRPAKGPERH